ncbi:MAG: lysine 2,3-aminomutase [Myxococcales bacterium]|nr:lysine 2,3-aminomutase [Myxococcales bacterium]
MQHHVPQQEAAPYRAFTRRDIDRIAALAALPKEVRDGIRASAWVLPFRTNAYVVEQLIDWSRIPEDPIFQLTFPQPEMLARHDFERMLALVQSEASPRELQAAARDIQLRLNPHPAGQRELNVPRLPDGSALSGVQHKYAQTALFFPSRGQTCHAYCTYCFRWAQFVGIDDLKFAAREIEGLLRYVQSQPELCNVLFTGGDPMVMRSAVLGAYVEPLLSPELSQVREIRIGTKAPAYWPQRFVQDPDADDLLRLFERVVASGRHLAVMAHYSHPRELSTPIAEEAIRRIRSTGAVVRTQAPVVRRVNDDAAAWAELWRKQVQLGAVPYYMFVERDTGPRQYFELPLVRAHAIFNEALGQVSGLGRTVRGPSMSATPGKVLIDGVARVHGERVFVLKFLQARDPDWVGRPFFARYDPDATWFDDLRPAFGEREFFFEAQLRSLGHGPRRQLLLADAAPPAE